MQTMAKQHMRDAYELLFDSASGDIILYISYHVKVCCNLFVTGLKRWGYCEPLTSSQDF